MLRWVVGCVLVLGLLVSGATKAQAQTTCPATLPLVNSWQNLSYPSGVSAIYDRIGGSKQINYGWGPSNLSGEPSGYGYANFHFGIDTNHVYERIYAPFNGTAYQISPSGWSGALIVKLVLPSGRYYYFAHLSDQIASGPVKVGDILAVTGNTGYSTGPHLHVQFMEADGTAIPPEHWACKSEGAGVTAGTTTTSGGGDFSDDFNRADGPVGNGWTTGGDAVITGNRLSLSNGYIVRDYGQTTGRAEYTIPAGDTAAGERWLVFRWVDANNYWLWGDTSGFGYQLWKVSAGNFTQVYNPSMSATAGARVAASWTPDAVTVYVNGTALQTFNDATHATGTSVGLRTRNNTQTFDDFNAYLKVDGTASPLVQSSTPDQVESSSGSGWNPMAWLWDKVKGVLIPSPDEWQEVAAEFNKLAEKEPIGTMRDVSGFASTVKAQMVAPAGGGGAPAVSGGPAGSLWGWFSFSGLWVAVIDAGNWLASIIEGVTLGSVNALQLFRLFTDALLLWGLVLMVSRKVHFAA